MTALEACLLMAAGLCLHPTGVFATGKPNGPPPATPAPIVLPDAAKPSEALTPYIVHLDPLLALQRAGDKPTVEFCEEASGRLLALRQQLLARQSEAPNEAKAGFTAAVATCDVISAALDARQKTIGDLMASRQTRGSGLLNQPGRKQTLTQGIDGGGLAKAAGAAVERDRERQAIADGKARTAGAESAMESMAFQRWNQRAVEWRQKIAAAYAKVR